MFRILPPASRSPKRPHQHQWALLTPSISGRKIVWALRKFPTSEPQALQNLGAALKQFNTTFTGIIQFVPRTTQADYVNFDFDPTNHSATCDPVVGRAGGEQVTGGSIDCSLGTLLHELGHLAGLYHEHSRPDRNNFVTISYANMIKGSKSNFDQLTDNYQVFGLYDYGSVMHYIAFAFSRNGGPVIKSIPPGIPLSNLTGYTAADIDGVKRLYGGAPKNVTIATNPPGLAVTVDGTNYTSPHTFNWALNTTHTLAVSAAAQTLAGATYVFGRWNDASAASHTIKISPGNKTFRLAGDVAGNYRLHGQFHQTGGVYGHGRSRGCGNCECEPPGKILYGGDRRFLC